MQGFQFIQDLALILVVGGVAGWICQRIGLSVIVGFLVAGMAIGPYMPPITLVADFDRIDTLAQMGLVRFLCWSTLGTIVWPGVLTGLGYVLGTRFSEVDRWLQPVSVAIIALAIVAYLYRLYRSNERA